MPVVHVLWVVALLAIIAGVLMPTGKTAVHQAHNAIDEIRIAAVAEAAFNRAALSLLEARPEARWRVDGVPQTFTFDGTAVQVTIQDEAGRIDLNQAEETLISNLLRSTGMDAWSAAALVDCIIDWRSTGSTRRLNGAKDAEYRAAGRNGPRNGPFQSVGELKLVLGMTPELFRRIEPALTVYSGRPAIDPQVAPPEALLALPGANAGAVALQVAARLQSPASSNGISPAAIAPNPFNNLIGHAFSIRVDIPRLDGRMTRSATIRLTDDPEKPIWILDWRTP